MSITDKIGIAVSGCKNGYSVFAATDNLDRNSADIKQALRDQRSFMRVNEPRHTYYTMSILSDKLVVSACRSSIDSVGSSGAYIAVSLFIPHFINIQHASRLLDLLLNAYWNEYMHPMFGSPIPGKPENINALLTILKANSEEFSYSELRYRITPSDHNLPPLYINFNSETDVDTVMSNPYHTQYSRGAEIIFLPRILSSDGPVSFNTEVKTISVQKAKPLSAIDCLTLPKEAAFSIYDYAVDGRAYPHLQDVSLSPQSKLSYTLQTINGQTVRFQGTLDEALRHNLIIKKNSDYELVPPRIKVRIRLTGHQPASNEILTLVNTRGEKAGAHIIDNDLYEWTIICGHFPYSLYRECGHSRTLLKRDAISVHSSSSEPIEIDITPENTSSPDTSKDLNKPQWTDMSGKKRLPTWLVASIAAGCVMIAALTVYIIMNNSEDNNVKETKSEESVTTVVAKTQYPDTTILNIPSKEITSLLNGQRFDNIELRGFPDEAIRETYNPKQGLIIKIPNTSRKKLGSHMEIIFLDKNRTTLVNIPIEPMTTEHLEDLMKFPKNTESRYTISFAPNNTDDSEPANNDIMSEVMDEATMQPAPVQNKLPKKEQKKKPVKQPAKGGGNASAPNTSKSQAGGKSTESNNANSITF